MGHTRIFNIIGSWVQLGMNINSENVGDDSGHSVRISSDGTKVAIGAYGNDSNGENSGHVASLKQLPKPSGAPTSPATTF